MVTLYKISAYGVIQQWSIEKTSNGLKVTWGRRGGYVHVQEETVELNKSGRNFDQQLRLRMDSRVNLQLDRGYCSTIDEAAKSRGLNATKRGRPMLAQKYVPTKRYDLKNMWWQYKYDGHRCLITREGDEIIAYSRNGKIINTISHITSSLNIPEGYTLDGELYIHDTPLQTISSIVRRVQPDNIKLKYVVYDALLEQSFSKRLDYIMNLRLPALHSFVAPTTEKPDLDMLTNKGIKEQAQAYGYEGFMLRTNTAPYEVGKRSDQLLKVKTRYDTEAKVIGILPSADGCAVLVCKLGNTEFKVVAPGTIEQKVHIYENAGVYIGKYVTVEYAELTKEGVPFHPVAIGFREAE